MQNLFFALPCGLHIMKLNLAGARVWHLRCKSSRRTLNTLFSLSEEELRKLKEENNAESLRQELEKERSRCGELEQKINDILRVRWASFKQSFPTPFILSGPRVLNSARTCRPPHWPRSLEDSPSQSPKIPPPQPPQPPQPPAASSSKGEQPRLMPVDAASTQRRPGCDPCAAFSPPLRQTEGHAGRHLPQALLRPLRRLHRGLPLPAGGADGGGGRAAQRQKVRGGKSAKR